MSYESGDMILDSTKSKIDSQDWTFIVAPAWTLAFQLGCLICSPSFLYFFCYLSPTMDIESDQRQEEMSFFFWHCKQADRQQINPQIITFRCRKALQHAKHGAAYKERAISSKEKKVFKK